MVKLTAELILKSPSYQSPVLDREIDLRGHNIPSIENLGVTKNQLDSIDLSDNAITALSNLPFLPRLKQVLLSNNPVASISPNIARALPNLQSLVLSGCQIKDLKDLDPLASLKHLEFLSLHHAPVSHLKHYRHWLVFRCQKLRVLDFEKVRDKERQQARTLFQTETGEWTPLATSISAQVTAAPSTNGVKTFEPGMQSEDKGRLLTADDKQRIKQAIESATSIEEVRKLQRALELGFVPSEKELAALRKGASGTQNEDEMEIDS